MANMMMYAEYKAIGVRAWYNSNAIQNEMTNLWVATAKMKKKHIVYGMFDYRLKDLIFNLPANRIQTLSWSSSSPVKKDKIQFFV